MTLKSKQCDCAEYRRIESACRELMAERDEWKRRAELMRKWLRNDFNNYNTRWDALVDEFPEAADWFEENGDGF